jgi:DNA-binding transcriptional regulator YhcF (GntR family)
VIYAARKAVMSGQMRPGDPFPSVRALGTALKINPERSDPRACAARPHDTGS